jgi:hypothetical protein
MGGLVLQARWRSNPKLDFRVWVCILFANLDFKKYIWSLYNSDTGGLPELELLCYCFVATTWGASSGVRLNA